MVISINEEFQKVTKQLISIAYSGKDLTLTDFEENHHPTKGFTKTTLSDKNGNRYSVIIFPNNEILLSEFIKEEKDI